jgi:LytS/YehU family sensor histidine kinase
LDSLIDLDTEKAKGFNRQLSMFYRDLLQFKDHDIITLKREIEFVKRYIYLQQIRFGDALHVEFAANEKIEGQVIPLTLQALVENAIKHNEISQANPLKIVIAISDDYELIVENNLQPKPQLEKTSGTGLQNLAGRYSFLTGKEMKISKNEGYFRVSLPLIKIEL